MTGRIFLKLIACVVFLLLVALAAVDYFATQVAQDTYTQNLTRQLADKAHMVDAAIRAQQAPDSGLIRQLAQAAGGRITIVRADGKVLTDSEAAAASMENHRARPEFVYAFQGKIGSDRRLSATLRVPFLYVAAPIPGGNAIRVAVPLSEIDSQVRHIRLKILAATALAFFPAVFLAALLARWLSRRFANIMDHAGELARGNFRARLPEGKRSEFSHLSRRLNETASNLQQTVEQLQREHAELEKVERIRKDFVINVSHELRTPLASIQGYTETLLDGAINDPVHNVRFLRIVRHNAERLARLTQDLLTLSRIEQRRQKFEFDYHAVNALLGDAADLVRPMAGKSNLELCIEPAPADALAWCDSEAVSQILSNLLDNAIKYTPAGGKLTLGARQAGEFHEIYVRDTGLGIPEEDLPRLFERFYRVDKARSRELGGTGLGLSIVKHLVSVHNGAVRVESKPNQGSTFLFTLPATEEAIGGRPVYPEFTTP